MKKFLSVSLAALLVLIMMVGCGKEVNDTPAITSDTTPEVSVEPTNTPNSKYGRIRWSSSKLAQLLPVPKSSVGETIVDNSLSYTVHIAETSFDDYYDYVAACEEAGFVVDYFKYDNYFSANNSDGHGLILMFDPEENMMSINVYPLAETPTPTEKMNPTVEATPEADSDGVTPEFKEMMDGYEEFIDEYIDFMDKYKKAEDQTSMLKELSEYIGKYAEFMDVLASIDDNPSSISDADYQYANEVCDRIAKKLKKIE